MYTPPYSPDFNLVVEYPDSFTPVENITSFAKVAQVSRKLKATAHLLETQQLQTQFRISRRFNISTTLFYNLLAGKGVAQSTK
jgi:hypothetical protein